MCDDYYYEEFSDLQRTAERFTLHYTTDDDGVHLACKECGGGGIACLGFDATIADALDAAEKHRCPPKPGQPDRVIIDASEFWSRIKFALHSSTSTSGIDLFAESTSGLPVLPRSEP